MSDSSVTSGSKESPAPGKDAGEDAVDDTRDDSSASKEGITPASEPGVTGEDYIFLFVVSLISLQMDLVSKEWAKTTFEAVKPGHPRKVVVIDELMNFIYAQNFGGAWGLLQNADESVRRPFFLAVSVAAIVFIVSLYRKLRRGQTALKWGLPLVLGGALGNLVDRVRYGFVVDFIDIYGTWGGREHHWPTFNIADIAICIGVVLMAVDMFTARPKRVVAAESDDAPPSSTSNAPSEDEAAFGDTPATDESLPDRAAATTADAEAG